MNKTNNNMNIILNTCYSLTVTFDYIAVKQYDENSVGYILIIRNETANLICIMVILYYLN